MPIKDYFTQRIIIPAAVKFQVNFNSNRPNFVIINSSIADIVFVSAGKEVDNSTYDMLVPPVSAKKFVSVVGLDSLSFYSVTGGVLYLQCFNDIVTPESFNYTSETVSAGAVLGMVDVNQINLPLPAGNNDIGFIRNLGIGAITDVLSTDETANASLIAFIKGLIAQNKEYQKPIAKEITLVAGVDNVVKASSGWVCSLDSALNDIFISNNGTDIYQNINGVYQGTPFYCDTDITLNSATGGLAYIIYL